MLFINTRPAERAQPLTEALQSLGVGVLELPLLQLQALTLTAELQAQFSQLALVHVVVVVSPMAVEVGIRYLQQLGISINSLAHLTWIAVGQGTAQCLQAYGIESQVPEIENSEGMLQIEALKQLPSAAKIAFWRGIGGRQFMMEHLTKAGYEILNMLLYRRICPETTQLQFAAGIDQMQQATALWVLISSEASWLNWLRLLADRSDLLQQAQYWTLGERLTTVLQDYAQQQKIHLNMKRIEYLNTDYLLEMVRLEIGLI